jgi:hypothetical protein
MVRHPVAIIHNHLAMPTFQQGRFFAPMLALGLPAGYSLKRIVFRKRAMKHNCWEYKGCGREPGGELVEEYGVCPAAGEPRLDGQNNGKNGGRSCWVVTGTIGEGLVHGKFVHKQQTCKQCCFYQKVHAEEGKQASSTLDLFESIMDMNADIR